MNKISKEHQSDIDDVTKWCEEEYNKHFSQYFEEMYKLYFKLQSGNKAITDDELESILTDIPLQLFSAAEALSSYKAGIEIVKLKMKMAKSESHLSENYSQVAFKTLEDEMLVKVYGTVVERVERQITFSKELIMSAKKIWSARKGTESIGVAADSIDLPDYSDIEKKTYIK